MDVKNMRKEMEEELTANILPFWMNRMTDEANGGFYGRITGTGILMPETEKGAVLNARILWTFSAAYRLLKKEEYLSAAMRAKRYVIDHFYDREFGGVYWSLDCEGRPLDTKKQIYAIGFAIYLDELERLAAPLPPVQQQGREKSWLNIALPKGRLGDKAYKLLAGAGYSATEDYNDTRKLVVENPDACVRYFLVKPSDVAIYVEHGAADIGIVGKDILTESGADVYELLDTGMGKCRMCVAGPAGFADDESRALRVATKFVNIARDHYERRGRDIDIVKLNGSIELAPILGLSDVIVDIVETGTTLKENDLTVIEEFMPISARFIANKASYKFKYAQLTELLNKMKEALAK